MPSLSRRTAVLWMIAPLGLAVVGTTVWWGLTTGGWLAGPAAAVAPLAFGLWHARHGDPAAIVSLLLALGFLAAAGLALRRPERRRLGIAAIVLGFLHAACGTFLVSAGPFPGAGSRGAIPWEGPTSSIDGAPLPGLRLHVFETGVFPAPGYGVFEGGSVPLLEDEPAFLIEHPSWGLLLFEAGYHPELARDPAGHIGPFIYHSGLLKMDQAPGQDARTQLDRAGFDPDRIRTVLVSHFHPEHGGAVELFPEAEIAVDRREHAYATGSPKYNFLRHEYDEVKAWRLLDFAGTPRFGPFEGSIDLAGDGSIVVVSTPGHTPGHLSLFLRLPNGPVLLSGDIVWMEQNLASRSIGLPFISVDGPAHRRSLGQLLAFVEAHPEVTVVPGHDLSPLRREARPDVVLHPFGGVPAAD